MAKVRITPDMAKQWLRADEEAGHANYRALDKKLVSRYARDMQKGMWDYNGETIKFNCNGRLVDGQHRLHAIVQSGVSINSEVITGIEHVYSIDRGKNRGVAAVLRANGEKNPNNLAAAVVMYVKYMRGRILHHARESVSLAEVLQTLDKNPGIRDSVRIIENHRRGGHKQTYFSCSALAPLHYMTQGIDKEQSDLFFNALFAGHMEDMTADQTIPPIGLREFLIWNRTKPANERLETIRLFASAIKAWNAFFTGKRLSSSPVVSLLWHSYGPRKAKFPLISGLSSETEEQDPNE